MGMPVPDLHQFKKNYSAGPSDSYEQSRGRSGAPSHVRKHCLSQTALAPGGAYLTLLPQDRMLGSRKPERKHLEFLKTLETVVQLSNYPIVKKSKVLKTLYILLFHARLQLHLYDKRTPGLAGQCDRRAYALVSRRARKKIKSV